ncbi:symmetrical bis(5'-nucleosyl)-tetraphosphatase [Janthinobacterium psychrotolerans]|uniref:Bis(5'-nucleosyl)-tetraphosphatase, symmetrical n=1 Tax=Janthinobacterium psychrotolerans TaxID=1747903 RepID=A0A1A7BXQ0_9BURK|nr:symmetrical bis(5'-nucleosyl)-tetraphosphatase [Janthinobacterium psychrotolerans]OBV37524.1 bis(5'-nucleosyl)-tetraphosphatase (symmetrical) [Janthinobacterium psychrotolerans]
MKTYFIGDLQGCHEQALELLARIADTAQEPYRLLFAGDLINRGPDSLATLRLVYKLAQQGLADSVLGNHDLHLLAVVNGIRPEHAADTLGDILAAPDRGELIDWLRRRPLALRHDGHLLVHAGLLPQWSVEQALLLAGEVSSMLASDGWVDFLRSMYGNEPAIWDDALRGADRLRCIINAMTRLRFCTAEGRMDFKMKESGSAPAGSGLVPWFEVPGRQSAGDTVVFGHWSALGLMLRPHLIALDSGCVWGGKLSAVCLEDRSLIQVDCPAFRQPAGKSGNT